MWYSLTQGVGQPDRPHRYSLYGGIERQSEDDSTHLKKKAIPLLLTPAAIVTVVAGLLELTGTTSIWHRGHSGKGTSATNSSLVASPHNKNQPGSGSKSKSNAAKTSSGSSSATNFGSFSSTPSSSLSGGTSQLVGGMGGGGSTPSAPSPPGGVKPVLDSIIQPEANVSTDGTSTTVSGGATVPATGTTATVPSTTIDP